MFYFYNEWNCTKYREMKPVPIWLAWDYLQQRMPFTVSPSLYNICCLRTYLLNLSCHSASPWMVVFSISERSTLTLSDRWILITAGLWHPFSSLGELIRLSFHVIFWGLRQRGIVLFFELLLWRDSHNSEIYGVWILVESFREFSSEVACL